MYGSEKKIAAAHSFKTTDVRGFVFCLRNKLVDKGQPVDITFAVVSYFAPAFQRPSEMIENSARRD